MEDQANRSNQTNQVVETTLLVHNLSFLGVGSHYDSKKRKPESTDCLSSRKRMKLWHQPSVHPIVFKERLKGRKRTKKFAKRSKLDFKKDVLVFSIPSRHDYSLQQKSLIWRDGYEIDWIQDRNHEEREFEGYDWRNVVEEEDMYLHDETGEMIHPRWVECEDSSYEVINSCRRIVKLF